METEVQSLVMTELRELSLDEQKRAVDQRIAERTEAFYRGQSLDPAQPVPRHVFVLPGTAPPRPPGTEHLSQEALTELTTGITEAEAITALRGRTPEQATVLVNAQAAESLAVGERVAALAASDEQRRATLAQAITAHAGALHVADAADQAVARARDQMAIADQALHDYDQLDAQITEFTIQAIKDATPTTLPQHLLLAQRMRAEAIDQSRYAQIAHGRLISEAQAVRLVVDQAATALNTAASHVLAATADAVAAELREADKHAAELRVKLRSIADCWLVIGSGQSRSVGLSNSAREALLAARLEPEPDRAQMQALRDWFAQLQSDATATISGRHDSGASS
jgi:hypothetical protein